MRLTLTRRDLCAGVLIGGSAFRLRAGQTSSFKLGIITAPVGGGFIDWKGQIQTLRKDRYDGTMSLETHYLRTDRNKIESTRESLDGLLKLLV